MLGFGMLRFDGLFVEYFFVFLNDALKAAALTMEPEIAKINRKDVAVFMVRILLSFLLIE